MFFIGANMHTGRDQQPLSYDMRLPDEAQADALRLLDASRAVVNALLVALWPRLDEFLGGRDGPAWKQVVTMTPSPDPHGARQFRCESETAGRILRAQAKRKQVFELIRPILADGFICPKTEKGPARKNRKTIKEAIETLQQTLEDDDTAFVSMQNVVEQACNYFLEQVAFPLSYEQMQPAPLLTVGMLTYAGDDGSSKGQTYRLSFDVAAGTASLRFRFPDEQGRWQWCKEQVHLMLPACVITRLKEVVCLAPNVLLLFAAVRRCSLICGESLKTLKSTGRGKGARGKWRNWRNNTTIRAEIWHILRYKSHLLGLRFRSERPQGTSHTCPRCGKPAQTYRSPRMQHRSKPVKWGRWLVCTHCSFNGDRAYCAAINIARLGMAFLSHIQATGKAKAYSVTDERSVKPVRYMPTGAVLLFPPQIQITRLREAGKVYINGWKKSATLRSSYATPLLLRLCG